MGHEETAGHSHGVFSAGRGGKKHQRRLLWSLAIIFGYFFVELIGGILTNSLALLSDAAHMFTDVLGLGMATAAIHAADRRTARQRTFGLYRLEILAALANTVLLFGVAAYIVYEAILRFAAPPKVLGLPMLLIAVLGLVVNCGVFLLLRRGADESLNVEGAYLEVLADLLGSGGVILAAVVVSTTGFRLIDPIVGVAIGVFVLPRTWRLGRKALRVLLQEAPPHLDVKSVQLALEQVDGVDSVHDLHLWTLTSGMEVCSVHICVEPDAAQDRVLDAIHRLLRDAYGVDQPTVQIEPSDFKYCAPEITARQP